MRDENEPRARVTTRCGPTPLPGEDRRGWMTLRHSGPVNVERLTWDLVDVRDIIAGLSGINRFNGQQPNEITVL